MSRTDVAIKAMPASNTRLGPSRSTRKAHGGLHEAAQETVGGHRQAEFNIGYAELGL